MSWGNRSRGAIRATGRTVAALRNVAAESQKSRLPQMAAALSYRTIFGLLPVIVVALLGLRALATDKDIDQLVDRALDYAGLSNIILSEQEAGATGETVPDEDRPRTPDELAPAVDTGRAGEGGAPAVSVPKNAPGGGGARTETGDASTAGHSGQRASSPGGGSPGSSLSSAIKALVKRAGAIDFRALSIIGVMVLIYAAISMLVEIERAFNQIYRVPAGKSWVRRVTQYWTLLTLGTLFLFGTFYFGVRFQRLVVSMAQAEGLVTADALWVAAAGYFVTVAISTTLFLLMYMLVPNTKVKLLPALAGALVAAILWEAGKWGFTQYLGQTTGYAKLYGSIALIPLFLLWIYVTWAIVLLGLHVSYFLQHTRRHTQPQRLDLEPAIVDPAAGLLVMEVIARGFQTGKPARLSALAEASRLSPGIVERILGRLAERGLVHKIGDGPEQAGYTLARPPESIAAADVLAVGHELAWTGGDERGGGQLGGGEGVVMRLRNAQLAAAGQTTLLTLMGATKPPDGATPAVVAAEPAVGAGAPGTEEKPGAPATPGAPGADRYSNGLGTDRLEGTKEGAR